MINELSLSKEMSVYSLYIKSGGVRFLPNFRIVAKIWCISESGNGTKQLYLPNEKVTRHDFSILWLFPFGRLSLFYVVIRWLQTTTDLLSYRLWLRVVFLSISLSLSRSLRWLNITIEIRTFVLRIKICLLNNAHNSEGIGFGIWFTNFHFHFHSQRFIHILYIVLIHMVRRFVVNIAAINDKVKWNEIDFNICQSFLTLSVYKCKQAFSHIYIFFSVRSIRCPSFHAHTFSAHNFCYFYFHFLFSIRWAPSYLWRTQQ